MLFLLWKDTDSNCHILIQEMAGVRARTQNSGLLLFPLIKTTPTWMQGLLGGRAKQWAGKTKDVLHCSTAIMLKQKSEWMCVRTVTALM